MWKAILLVGLAVVALAGCGGAGSVDSTPTSVGTQTGAASTPTQAATETGAIMTMTPQSQSQYPKRGHAPDYSWVAGQVAFTQIQGGCIYIRTGAEPAAQPTEATDPGSISTVVVGTASRGDTSPALRDITPQPTSAQGTQPKGDSWVPGGPGWDLSKVQDGAYVVAFGHPAGPDEPREICPGGSQYVVERLEMNP